MTGAATGRQTIDPVASADAGERLQGELPVAACGRIVGAHGPQPGIARYVLEFGRDDEGLRHVRGSVSAEVRVSCRRCLAPLDLALAPALALGIVADEEAAERLPERYDPLVATGPMPLAQVLEDELLLALPLAPAHPAGSCSVRGADDVPATGEAVPGGPFAMLARLRGGYRQDE